MNGRIDLRFELAPGFSPPVFPKTNFSLPNGFPMPAIGDKIVVESGGATLTARVVDRTLQMTANSAIILILGPG